MAKYSGKRDKGVEISAEKLYNKSAGFSNHALHPTSIDVAIYKPKT